MENNIAVTFDRRAPDTVFEKVSEMQFICKKNQAKALAALMAKCQRSKMLIEQTGKATIAFNLGNPFEMQQFELLTRAMTGEAKKAGEKIDSLALAAMCDKDQHERNTQYVKMYLPSIN